MCRRSPAIFHYTSYEVANATIIREAQDYIRAATSYEEATKRATQAPHGDRLFEATRREQRIRGPVEHTEFFDCFACLARFIDTGMNCDIAYGAIALGRLLILPATHALWIIRDLRGDVSAWNSTETEYQDPHRLLEELRSLPSVKLRDLFDKR